MSHCYVKNQRLLTIGEIDVRIPADAQVRVTALQTELHRVTTIATEQRRGQQSGPTGGSFSPVLQLRAATLLLPSLSKTHTELKK